MLNFLQSAAPSALAQSPSRFSSTTSGRQQHQQRHFLPRFLRRYLYRYPNAPLWAFGLLSVNIIFSRLWYDAYQIYKKGYAAYKEELGGDNLGEREKAKWKYGEFLVMPFSGEPLFLDTPEDIEWRKKRDRRIKEQQLDELLGEDWREQKSSGPKSSLNDPFARPT